MATFFRPASVIVSKASRILTVKPENFHLQYNLLLIVDPLCVGFEKLLFPYFLKDIFLFMSFLWNVTLVSAPMETVQECHFITF